MQRLKQWLESDIPFARDDANRLLPAMIGCLVGFAALLFAAALSLHGSVAERSRDVIGVLQVEVPRARGDDPALMANLTRQLMATPGVLSVDILNAAQVEALLKPWLGAGFTLGDLPVPVLVDVKTRVESGKSMVDVSRLQQTLTKLDGNIRIEESSPWVAQVASATRLLQSMLVGMALLLLVCVIGISVLVAKTSLRLHFKTVSLLHMFGATDEYILRQFQANSTLLALRGASAGVVFAGVVLAGAALLASRWENSLLPGVHIGVAHLLLFLALPLLTASSAFVTTRRTVRHMLRHMH